MILGEINVNKLTLDKIAVGEMTIDKMMINEIIVYEMIGRNDVMSVCQRKLQKFWKICSKFIT